MKSINHVLKYLFCIILFGCSTNEAATEDVIPEILTLPSSVAFADNQGSQLVDVSANVDWRVNNDINWIKRLNIF